MSEAYDQEDPMGLVAEALVEALLLGNIEQARRKLERASTALDAAEEDHESDCDLG